MRLLGGAPVQVIEMLVAHGAWRTLYNERGERPMDVAVRRGHLYLKQALTPKIKQGVPDGVLARIQQHFHSVIRGRLRNSIPLDGLRLPELQPLTESVSATWFAVPGMYGGFHYGLKKGATASLISESWIRIVGGSGERHVIDSAGSNLVESGFC